MSWTNRLLEPSKKVYNILLEQGPQSIRDIHKKLLAQGETYSISNIKEVILPYLKHHERIKKHYVPPTSSTAPKWGFKVNTDPHKRIDTIPHPSKKSRFQEFVQDFVKMGLYGKKEAIAAGIGKNVPPVPPPECRKTFTSIKWKKKMERATKWRKIRLAGEVANFLKKKKNASKAISIKRSSSFKSPFVNVRNKKKKKEAHLENVIKTRPDIVSLSQSNLFVRSSRKQMN